MSKFGISQSVPRLEDVRLVTGAGRYMDDINAAAQVYGYVLRSPSAHADIKRLDLSAARAAGGVLTVLSHADLADQGADVSLPCDIPLENRDGSDRADPARPALAKDRVRYVGEPVAFIVAETLAAAKDAAERVELELGERDAVADTAAALEPGRPLVHDEAPNNVAFDWSFGEREAVDQTFEQAAHVTRLELINNRVIVNSMETRGVLADFREGRLALHSGTQGGWGIKQWLAQVLGCDAEQVQVLTPADVGGGFGMKAMVYPEMALCALASRQLGRPVKWIGERSESFLADTQGRDHVTVAELAFDDEQRICAMRVDTTANMGAGLSLFAPFIPTGAALKVLPGVYDVKQLYYRVRGVFSHTAPIDAYRGAGRPESIYVIERLIELAARDLKVERNELRRKNFIAPEKMPFTTAVGETYDTGEFAKVMDAALEQADWAGFDARRRASAAAGKLRGIGMAYYIESTMGDPAERAELRFTADGTVEIMVGTQSNGQGHETAYAQILHDKLGVPFDKIRTVQGDTDLIPSGGGTGGSRSVTAEGWAIGAASATVIERGKRFAARELEAAAADVEFDSAGGRFSIAGTDRGLDIMELADKVRGQRLDDDAGQDGGQDGGGGLDVIETIEVGAWTFPNGCHIAEVEIDPDTGTLTVSNYSVVDDFGNLINPMLVQGQVHGGVVQGLGQALMEQAVYDDGGQLLTGSFMDYSMPRADSMPDIDFSNVVVPCATNPLGIKGCGEAGSVGACGAVINAIIDALAELGVDRVDMPATPQSLWRLIDERRKTAAA